MTYTQLVTPLFSYWIVTVILFSTFYIYRKLRIRNLLAICIIQAISSGFLFFESLYVLVLDNGWSIGWAMQFSRLQELVLVIFFPGVAFFLDNSLDLSENQRNVNRFFSYFSIIIAFMFFVAAFLFPDSFISVENLNISAQSEFSAGRGVEGVFFTIRDIFLIFLMIYALTMIILAKRKDREDVISMHIGIGLLIPFLFGLFDIYKNFTGEYLLFSSILIPRFDVGLCFFAYISFYAVLRHFSQLYVKNKKLTELLDKEKSNFAHLAAFDIKTDTFNRRSFILDLDEVVKRSCFSGVVMLDIEGFHDLNEAFGSDVGDAILIQAAGRIKEHAREGDKIYRMGSDEFAIILEELPGKDYLIRYVEVLHSILSQVYLVDQQEYYIHSSMGILSLPDDAGTSSDALSYLFSALRAAKHKKSSLVFFNINLRNEQERKALLAHNIRESLTKNEFYVVYQPIVDEKKQIKSAEALIRWNENYFPDEFIPLAESAGLMQELGTYIFNLIIRDLLLFPQLPIPIHINLSPAQFKDDDFASLITARLNASGIEKERVGFEITESFMIRDEISTLENLHQLKNYGYSLALDDFGTGFSSLSYLNKLPIDVLKIDKAFVDQLLLNQKEDKLITSIIELAHKFNFNLIAEGVEVERQFDVLKSWGVQSFQGYLFHKPMRISELDSMLKDRT